MAFVLAKSSAFAVAAKKPVSSRRSSVVVRATAEPVPENVKEARAWIDAWKNKSGGSASYRDANLPSWFPGANLPGYLDGTLPADFGFDPLGLGRDPAALRWYVQAELVHCRFAMLAVAGILFPELAANIGIKWPGAGVPWYDAGKFDGYFAPADSLFGVQMLLFAWAEIRRLQDIRNPGSANQDPIFPSNKLPPNEVGYPGGIFDPFGWSKGSNLRDLKVKEIKNGRLAMLAFVGFAGQAYTTGTTPLANLSKHLSDPWSTTVWQNDLTRLS